MMTFIRPRLRKPLVYALAGTAIAVAWAVRGSPSWYLSIVIEAGVALHIDPRHGTARTGRVLPGAGGDWRRILPKSQLPTGPHQRFRHFRLFRQLDSLARRLAFGFTEVAKGSECGDGVALTCRHG